MNAPRKIDGQLDRGIDRRIFIVGAPRSGTTLLQSLMASHSTLTSFPETHFFDKPFGPRVSRYKLREDRLSSILTEFAAAGALAGLAHETARERVMASAGASEAALRLVALLDEIAAQRGFTAWLEKTPDHVFRIPLISRTVPDAVFVHIVRDPCDAIPSLYRAKRGWSGGRSWFNTGLHWALAVRASSGYTDDPRHAIVHYERLLAQPREQLARLFDWLGLAWEDSVMTSFRQTAQSLVTGDEPWKSRNLESSAIAGDSACREDAPNAAFLRLMRRTARYDTLALIDQKARS